MASSILSGDRRCSTARGKMTVIGKLPKPINLPSQKLENRGLDPNVEIVPKGTLTWGSKSSLPTPNAWASSAVSSPYTDGTASSPVTGRPSSGGGGPRPSTSGSDRSHEAVSSAWGSNSRPSSASGILATNQTSLAASRPQSAETRPGSSQLSRFAENSSENTTSSWVGNTGTAEKGGSGTSKSSGFMLISGEFPSLGSEKNPEQQLQRGHSSQGRPTSASNSSLQKEEFGNPADGKIEPCSGNNNSGKMEPQQLTGGAPPPNNENWQRNPLQGQPYPTVNMPPPQFDAWRGPPVRPPDGIWYTVGTAGGPFRPAGPPGSYPIDHYAFYPSQHPGPLPNSQPVPRPGPSGVHYLKNGEAYRPQLSQESYAVPNHPIISVRPGLYQNAPYDGYLGPRASFCNPTEREVSTMGTVGPGIYSQFNRNANVESGKFLVRPDIRPSIIAKEHVKSGQFSDIHHGQYKVLLKQHDSCEGKDVEEKKEQSTLDGLPYSEERKQYDSTTHEDGMKNRSKDEGSAFAKAVPMTETSQSATDWDGRSSNANTKNSLKDSSKITNEALVKRPDGFTGIPAHDQRPYSVVKKDASLMEKIEVLNNKARNVDGDCEGAQFPSKEVKNHKVLKSHIENPVQVLCANNNSSRTSGTYPKGRSAPYQTVAPKAEKIQFGNVIPQPFESQVITVGVSSCPEDNQKLRPQVEKRVSVTQGPVDYHTESRLAGQNDNESIKRTSGRSFSETVPSRKSEIGTVTNLPDCHTSQEMVEKLEVNYTSNAGSRSYAASSIENNDHKTQRARQKELTAQRAKQPQKEEERDREQKAKPLAKLEGWNRRSLARAVDQNPNTAATPIKVVTTAVVNPSTNSEVRSPGWPRDPSLHVASQQSKLSSCTEGHGPAQDCSLGQDADISGHVTHKTSPHFQENNFLKHKRLGYRKKQNSLQEKNPCEQPVNMGDLENCSEVPVQELAVEALPVISEMPMQHKKKNNRTTKNKMKMEEAPSGSTLSSSAQNEINDDKCLIDDRKTQSSASVADVMPNPSQSVNEILNSQTSKDVVPSSYSEGSARASEEQHGRVNDQWKSQSSRRSTRYQQSC
ncbi:protein MODIFIER OF SNC1 1-like isoform X2 [Dioscorea cayenensis subsp. rotundata]|uniref:Protein MODIFIER OF SNC1 1-like isoform X2 n=1 Tax=Dioscorea cayennensis subsp. rotundata TaxID=55577 RepID=A0AB40AID0_DIOCR|nr:protein MODIFIER OF SNC1 1-like isoform X2 [Dioscorea cayenensis subsp. rotundata]